MIRLIFLSTLIALFFPGDANHPHAFVGDDVRGTYWNAERTAHIRVYRAVNGMYYGKIEWLKDPNDENGNPKTDPNNPDPELRSRPRIGMVVMKSFEWNEDDQIWEDGTIYDPNDGKTYDGYMRFEGNNKDKLYLRGYVLGMTWLGRTAEWERVKE